MESIGKHFAAAAVDHQKDGIKGGAGLAGSDNGESQIHFFFLKNSNRPQLTSTTSTQKKI